MAMAIKSDLIEIQPLKSTPDGVFCLIFDEISLLVLCIHVLSGKNSFLTLENVDHILGSTLSIY